ncbi:MAG: GntR family transcriptional regulator, partial [Verrucomicrobia bacterium]|nr:GntR family transcriptional regulator [Verrucomicrobiota bacterium]
MIKTPYRDRTPGGFALPRYVALAESIQRDIESGRFSVGKPLPAERELARTFDVAHLTIRHALSLLAKKGMISRQHGRGTFVQSASATAVIGILIGPNLLDEPTYFYRALVQTIRKEVGDHRWNCRLYDDLTARQTMGLSGNSLNLIQDIRHHAFKGLIWIGIPPGTMTDEIAQSDLPNVAFGSTVQEAAVNLDLHSFTFNAASCLAQQGRRRLVYLRTYWQKSRGAPDVDGLLDAAAAHRFQMTRESICPVEGFSPQGGIFAEKLGYEQMLKLMKRWDAARAWPDGLIVPDDVLMRGVAAAL